MTPWDDDKSTAADPDNPAADEQLTADEWDAHVTEGHFPADELNFGVDAGDPVMTDPQNGDQIVARYDRSAGSWVVDALETDSLSYVADYIVDTEDDLQSIVSGASAGETVVVGRGTHTVTLDGSDIGLHLNTDDVRLHLVAGATIQLGDNEIGSSENGHLIQIGDGTADGPSGVKITGLGTIDGNQANNDTTVSESDTLVYVTGEVSDCLIADVTIQNHDGDALWAAGVDATDVISELTIRDVTIKSCGEGILWQYSDGVVIDSPTISVDTQDAIEPATGSTDWEVLYPVITNSGQQGIDVFGGASQGKIKGGRITGWGTAGIDFSDTSSESIDVEVVDVTLHDRDGTASGPAVRMAGAAHEVYFDGLHIHDTPGRVFDVPAGPEIVHITNCEIHDTADYIQVTAGSGKTRVIRDNIIYNVEDATSPDGESLNVNGSPLLMSGNTIYFEGTGAPNYAARITASDGFTSYNLVEGADFGTGALDDASGAGHSVTSNQT